MGAGEVGRGERERLEAGEADRHRRHRREREEVEAGAEAELGHVEARAQARGQVVAGEEHVARLVEPAGEAEIGIVEPGRDRHPAVAPVERRGGIGGIRRRLVGAGHARYLVASKKAA